MAKNKTAGCCCGKCGERLTGTKTCCCSHTCGAICVTLEGGCADDDTDGGDCTCDEPAFTYLEYDATLGTYHGTIGCGNVSLDLSFEVKYCEYSRGCVICLTSSCLGDSYGNAFDGDCDNTVSCQSLGESTANCIGTRTVDDATLLEGGVEHEWNVDVSGCGDTNCTSFKLRTKCTGRVFPKEITEDYNGCGCIGCKCLCSELCFTYRGANTCEDGARVKIDGDTWSFEVTQCEHEPSQQGRAITVQVVKNEYDSSCELLVNTTGYTNTETTVPLTECPEIPSTRIYVDDTETDYFEFGCWKCGLCPDELVCVCECDPESTGGRGYEVSKELTIDWTTTNNAGTGTGTVTLTRYRESCVWEGTTTIACDDGVGNYYTGVYTFSLQKNTPNGTESCGWALDVSYLAYDSTGTTEPVPPSGCYNEYLDIISDWSSGGSPWGSTSCVCDPFDLSFGATPSEDETIAIGITE